MAPRETLKGTMETAAEARTDLTIFYGVVALLEGGTLTAHCNSEAQRIIKICKKAAERCLLRMDGAIIRATVRYVDRPFGRETEDMIAKIIQDEIGGEKCTPEWARAAADRIACALRNNEQLTQEPK